jgi:uncharacterized protein
MNPFFFGTSARQLFGMYHPPRAETTRATGVVLCYPFGQEYMRSHRAFRQLANLLTKAGFPVLRFDYSGSGDSAGESDVVSLARWQEDIDTAIDELRDTAEVQRVALVGLRLGAALALRAAAPRADVAAVVCWDPIVDGPGYVREMTALAEVPAAVGAGDGDEVMGVMGFPVTTAFRRDLQTLDARTPSATAPAPKALVIAAAPRDTDTALAGVLEATGCETTYRLLPSEGSWGEVDNYGSALIPQQIVQGIVAYLGQETA